MTTSTGGTADPQEPSTPQAENAGQKAFGWTYWMCNSIEMFERLAYFGIRSVVPIYIMQATEPGGLHMTAMHKGWVYMWWAIFQSWLPMFTGGFADRYGYKRVLSFAISLNAIGYLIMALFHSYHGFFAGILVLAIGTAFFKPALQGSIAQNLNKANSSMGWGIFYWVVNVGAVCAPVLATIILGKPHSAEGWRNLFLASSAYTCVNLFLLFTFKDVPSGADKSLSILKVFWVTIENICFFWFKGGKFHLPRGVAGLLLGLAGLYILVFAPLEVLGNWQPALGGVLCVVGSLLPLWLQGGEFVWQLRLPAFLAIMSCFWLMMYQLWDLHPNFIEDWIDSSAIAERMPIESWREYGDRGLIRVPQQILLNLNAFLIVALIVPISYLVRKLRTLSAMLIGMSVATGGILVAGLTGSGWVLLLGIVFFSLGEMLTGPKKNQYLGLIAPPGKKGLYLGYVNIPVGVGVGLGSIIAGIVYDRYGEKATLSLKYLGQQSELVAKAAQSSDWSDALETIPPLAEINRSEAFALACEELGTDEAAGADALRNYFRHDRGQVVNLGLQYLAQHENHREKVNRFFADEAAKSAEEAESSDAGESPSGGEPPDIDTESARVVHRLPKATGVKRPQVFEIVRHHMNAGKDAAQRMGDSAIVESLWDRFGSDPETLNNLGLEYLAQKTNLVHDAVKGISFDNPVEEMPSRIGIGRTKSFAALSAALGAESADVDRTLRELESTTDQLDERAYVYLIDKPHHRFLAVGQKEWKHDRALLEEIIESDDASISVARDGLGSGTAAIDYAALSGRQSLIEKALDAKDWSNSPDLAARLLRLNPVEARARVSAEINDSPQTTTALLWTTYSPQYMVWLPFAAIGVLATIALAIFGQMAKRWADMNA